MFPLASYIVDNITEALTGCPSITPIMTTIPTGGLSLIISPGIDFSNEIHEFFGNLFEARNKR
jgi:hypothetical protein